MRRALVVGYMTLVALTGFARNAHWQRAFPSLPDVRAVVWYDAPSTWWVTSIVKGEGLALLRTTDDGATWETIGAPFGRERLDRPYLFRGWGYAVHRADASVLYRTGYGIERSNDRGVTWSRPSFDPVGDDAVRFGFEDSDNYIAVSPTDPDRIAYVTHATMGVGGAVARDLATGDARRQPGGSSVWAHPETGIVYWRAYHGGAPIYGVVGFVEMAFGPLGGWHDRYGGTGFSSNDPTALLDVSTGLSAGPVVVEDAGGDVLHRFTDVRPLVERPTSVGIDMATGAFYLSGTTRVASGEFDEAVIVSTNGGTQWTKIGDRAGQLYFLSGRPGVYLTGGG